jgi:hypothetical protein
MLNDSLIKTQPRIDELNMHYDIIDKIQNYELEDDFTNPKILSVPPTSASVERVFSFGGRILRPERRRLNNDIFEKIIFNKLNREVFLDI